MIKLLRKTDIKSAGTIGTIVLGDQIWWTMEPPWKENKRGVSCVPDGDYVLLPWSSEKYGKCFIMVNPDLKVYRDLKTAEREAPGEGRSKCLFVHKGNFVNNFQGCVGASHGYDEEKDMLLSSTIQACVRLNRLVREEGSYRLRILSDD